VLKKAGIVVAAATAGMLAVSPLAFAQIIAIGDITVNANPQCNLDQNDVLRNSAFGILQLGNNKGGGKGKSSNKLKCSQNNSTKNNTTIR
jgi:hypothetical protein